ncbi:hypothetical protein D9611_009267 [Ephemerocybe angulata]|uniref:Uncharacterized protein n=1 Tax=Ephemerocybe angulata TaxID=980116 RepID=A0A8H5BJ71_9AGAR|nr:hypothetical protein D9611_009267 [Tulosesus angulatus]
MLTTAVNPLVLLAMDNLLALNNRRAVYSMAGNLLLMAGTDNPMAVDIPRVSDNLMAVDIPRVTDSLRDSLWDVANRSSINNRGQTWEVINRRIKVLLFLFQVLSIPSTSTLLLFLFFLPLFTLLLFMNLILLSILNNVLFLNFRGRILLSFNLLLGLFLMDNLTPADVQMALINFAHQIHSSTGALPPFLESALSSLVTPSQPLTNPSSSTFNTYHTAPSQPLSGPSGGSAVPPNTGQGSFNRDPPPHFNVGVGGPANDGGDGGGRSGGSSGGGGGRLDPRPDYRHQGGIYGLDYTVYDCLRDITPESFLNQPNPFALLFRLLRKGNQLYISSISTVLEKREHWTDWDSAVRHLLISYNLLGLVLDLDDDGAESIPTPLQYITRPLLPHEPSKEDLLVADNFDQLDRAVTYVLTGTVSVVVQRKIAREVASVRPGSIQPTCRIIYRFLRRTFGVGNTSYGAERWQAAVHLACGSDVADYLQQFTQLVLQVDRSGYIVDPVDMIRVFVLRLPRFMSHFANNFNTWCDSSSVLGGAAGFGDVLDWLERAEASFNNLRATHRQTQHLRSVIQPPNRSHPSGPRPPAAPAPRSHAAVGPSGGSSDSRTPGARPSSQQCYNCKKVGHSAANCRAPGGGRSNVGAPMGPSYLANEGDDDGDVLMAEVDNFQVDDATVPEGDVGDDVGALLANDFNSLSLNPDFTCDTYTNSTAFHCYAALPEPPPSPPAFPPAVKPSSVAVLDSGCSQHIIRSREAFSSFRVASITVGTAANKPLVAHGCGTVRIPIRLSDGTSRVLVLLDCLFAPDCPVNLLSVGRLVDGLGLRVMFAASKTYLWEYIQGVRPTAFLSLTRRNNLTYLGCTFLPASLSPSDGVVSLAARSGSLSFTPPPLTIDLWHRRFSHLGWDSTKALLRGTVVTGVTCVGPLTATRCVACIEGKGRATPYAHNMNRASFAGELLHVDTGGPMRVLCCGNRFWLVVVDDFTNFAWVFLMRTRDEAVKHITNVIAVLENISGKRVGFVRSDGAKEFVEGDMKRFLLEKGIRSQTTVPYAHQQNGKAERYIGRMSFDFKALLAASGLPPMFWGFAILTAAYTANRTPTSTLSSGITPFEALFGKKPDVSHLRVFGCRCFPLTPSEIRPKLSPYRREAIFIGYESDRVGWRCMLTTGKILFSNDVIFDEGTMGRLAGRRAVSDDAEDHEIEDDRTGTDSQAGSGAQDGAPAASSSASSVSPPTVVPPRRSLRNLSGSGAVGQAGLSAMDVSADRALDH